MSSEEFELQWRIYHVRRNGWEDSRIGRVRHRKSAPVFSFALAYVDQRWRWFGKKGDLLRVDIVQASNNAYNSS